MSSDSEDSQRPSRPSPSHGVNSTSTDTTVSDSDLANRLQELLNDSLYANRGDGSDESSVDSMLKKGENESTDSSSLFSLGSDDLFESESSNSTDYVPQAPPASSSSVINNKKRKFSENDLYDLPSGLTTASEKMKNWFSVISHGEMVHSRLLSSINNWSKSTEHYANDVQDDVMSCSQNSPPGTEGDRENFEGNAKYDIQYESPDTSNHSTCSDPQPMEVAGFSSNSNSPSANVAAQYVNTVRPPKNLDPDVTDDDEPMDVAVISSNDDSEHEVEVIQLDDVEMTFPIQPASPEHRLRDIALNAPRTTTMTRTEYGRMLDAYLRAQENHYNKKKRKSQ